MLMVKLDGAGEVEQYPYTRRRLERDNRGITFPDVMTDAQLAQFSAANVSLSTKPDFDPMTEQLTEIEPAKIGGQWVQQWQVSDLSSEAIAKKQQDKYDETKLALTDAVQKRLDDFAKTRNYMGILSLCTYATSAVTKFATEGQYGVDVRDATWTKCYEILAEVDAGTRPIPEGFSDIVSELPELEWPM